MQNSDNARLVYYAQALQNALLFSTKCYFEKCNTRMLERAKLNIEDQEMAPSALASLKGMKDKISR